VADLGEGPGGYAPPPSPASFGLKKNIAEGRKAGRASKEKKNRPPLPLAQGLDLPLLSTRFLTKNKSYRLP